MDFYLSCALTRSDLFSREWQSASYDKTVKIWDLSTARLVGDPIVPGFQVSCVSYVPMQGESNAMDQRGRAAGAQGSIFESLELMAEGNETVDDA